MFRFWLVRGVAKAEVLTLHSDNRPGKASGLRTKCYNVTFLALVRTSYLSMKKAVAGLALLLALLLAQAVPVHAAENQIAVVAAENFYGDIARQIGGDRVAVVSIMNNPDQDPHLFETTPSIVRQTCGRADRDPQWRQLRSLDGQAPGCSATRGPDSRSTPHSLPATKPGDNPHLWYDPATMPAVATALADALAKADSAHAAGLQRAPQSRPSPRSDASHSALRS